MVDNAVLGCGTCYFDCRFSVSRLPGNFKVITQILGCFSSGCEGQNAFGARPLLLTHLEGAGRPLPWGCSWAPSLHLYWARHGATGRNVAQRQSSDLLGWMWCLFARCRQPAAKHRALNSYEWLIDFLGNSG